MVAFNFSPEFADAVAAGTKRQTIRRTARAKPGDRLQLYTMQRTTACRKLGDGTCEFVGYVGISPDGITLSDKTKHPGNIDDFARADGFENFAAMLAWFTGKYGSPYFQGYVHRWVKD